MSPNLSEALQRSARSLTPSTSGSSASTTGSPKPECPICGGSGWLRTERNLNDPLFGKLSPCECQGDRDLERLRALSGLNGSELQITLSDLVAAPGSDTERMIAACRGFIDQPRGFLTLWGGVGTGKTTCLQAVTNALLRRGAVYVSLHELLAFVRAGFDSDAPGDSAHARLQRFENVAVLCLDEIDKVQDTGWVSEQLTALVDARFRSALSGETGTLVALNKSPDEQPPWIASRLRDGRCRVVHNAGDDVRMFMRRAPGDAPSPAAPKRDP